MRVRASGHTRLVRGDRVEILVDAGGQVRSFDIEATRAGRRVEISTGRNVVEVAEVTRSGRVVRTGRFMAGRVIALVEHPRDRPEDDEQGDQGQLPLDG